MPYCTKCGNALDPDVKFCKSCGAVVSVEPAPTVQPAPAVEAVPVAEPVPAVVYAAPVVEAVPVTTYTAPPAPPTVPVSAKVQGFVGMGLGIFGLVFACFTILFTLVGIASEDAFSIGMALGYSFFSLPLSIVGRILAGKGQDAGNTSGACTAGRATGLAGIIVSAISLFISFCCLMAI